jgi:hypothetical protein
MGLKDKWRKFKDEPQEKNHYGCRRTAAVGFLGVWVMGPGKASQWSSSETTYRSMPKP